ncbi:hypothetical protein MTR67_005412 [Solanum verrucosum]|uniref:ATP-dependent Clp protease proteolytic subunit n=1 Tax=Solanum verrucosum TaxID=315347 RepID=A0AAF0PW87_SOLVR|nr:hypothetical protein MTR67_005412 [Solanum verrucosum]
MATCLRLPMASSIPCSSSSSMTLKHRSFNIRCAAYSNSSSNIPMPPFNPKDPFLSKLASVAAINPDALFSRPQNSDMPPFLDIYDSPKLMATPAQVERSVSYNEHRASTPPPDLPSMLLHGRIVYIGMPVHCFIAVSSGDRDAHGYLLVSAVTELVIAELMYLQYMDPKAPIYLYINSTGTTRDDGETVGMEAEGFAIYDSMMQLQNEIHTVAVGAAIGQACLLLAAGTKGKRFMMPHAKAMIQQPRAPSSGLMQASDVYIRAKEVVVPIFKTSIISLSPYSPPYTSRDHPPSFSVCSPNYSLLPTEKSLINLTRHTLGNASEIKENLPQLVIVNRDTLVKLLAKHTENSEETVSNVMRRPYYMDSIKAREFGVIDKILWRGQEQEQIMASVDAPEVWDNKAGIKVADAI